MQKLQRVLPFLYLLFLFILVVYQLNSVQQFVFFHREQQQILAWDWDLFCERYTGVSGLALFGAHVFTQLYYLPWAGAVVTGCLAMLAVCCLAVSIQSFTHSKLYSLSLAMLPVTFELSNIADYNYHYQGFISFVLLAVLAALYAKITVRMNGALHLAVSIFFTCLLFYLAGPLCLPFALYVLALEFCQGRAKWYYFLATVLVAALSLFYAERWCWLPSMSRAFTPELFYYHLLPTPESCIYSWVCLLIYPFIAWFFSKFSARGALFNTILSLMLFFSLAGFTYTTTERDRTKNDPLVELQCYVIQEDWDAILRSPYARVKNYLFTNYVNLALSKKGLLVKHFFDYEQHDPQNIMVEHAFDDNQLPLSFIFAVVNYQMGDMGAAQNHAHDSFVCTTYGHPYFLQMLVKTNMIRGAYPVAEKYISLLEKTWHYADWARNMRRFLYNDPAVVADAELGAMRKNLPANDFFTLDPFECLYQILQANPNNKAALEYLIAYQFIFRDTDDINRMVETFYNTPVLNPFPEQLQEAYLLVNDLNFDYCQEHGVSEEVVQRYKKFLTVYNMAAQRGKNPQQAVRQEFGNSIFYNFMFK